MDSTSLISLLVVHFIIAAILKMFMKSIHVVYYLLIGLFLFVFIFKISLNDIVLLAKSITLWF
jgi:hypothetical protein